MLKLGLMGCGTVASYGHLPAIVATPGLKLTALYDPDPRRLAEAAARFGHPAVCTDIDAFFAVGLDAVTVTSAAPAHLPNVLAAARQRKPVLCEKPLALNERDAGRMIAAMRRARVPLYVGFTYRFSPVARRIRELVVRGAIGRVRSLRLLYLWDVHGQRHRTGAERGQINQRRVGRMEEGGPMIDCGTHQIDLARYWLGSEVVRFHGEGAWVENYAAPDHMWLHLEHACGAHTCVEISYSYGHTARQRESQFTYELIGTDGIIRFQRETGRFELINSRGSRRLPVASEKNFTGMYRELVRALTRGEAGILPTGEEGRIVMRLARQGTLQAMRRRRIRR